MKYYRIHPEVPGGIGENTRYDKDCSPWELVHFHAIFEGWLGGEILKISNCYLVTSELRKVLEKKDITGIECFTDVEIEVSNSFTNLYPNRSLPKIYRMVVSGKSGIDDFGMIDYYKLAVSEKALDLLKSRDVSDMEIYDFVPEHNI